MNRFPTQYDCALFARSGPAIRNLATIHARAHCSSSEQEAHMRDPKKPQEEPEKVLDEPWDHPDQEPEKHPDLEKLRESEE
jgi:hypothetical protein